MTSTIAPSAVVPAAARPSSAWRRVRSLATAEIRLLSRSGTALATAALLPPGTVLAILSFGAGEGLAAGAYTSLIVTMTAAWMLMLGVYFNLTSVYVARREDRVFKRLTTGEATVIEVIAAAAVPPALLLGVQVILALAVAGITVGMPEFVNPVLAVLGLTAGAVVFSLLAAASTSFTSTVEAAQYSTLPVLTVSIFLSGVTFPLQYTPEAVQVLARLTPLYAVCDLITLGLTGATMAGEAATSFAETFMLGTESLACLAVWVVVAHWLAVHYLRVEPRR